MNYQEIFTHYSCICMTINIYLINTTLWVVCWNIYLYCTNISSRSFNHTCILTYRRVVVIYSSDNLFFVFDLTIQGRAITFGITIILHHLIFTLRLFILFMMTLFGMQSVHLPLLAICLLIQFRNFGRFVDLIIIFITISTPVIRAHIT